MPGSVSRRASSTAAKCSRNAARCRHARTAAASARRCRPRPRPVRPVGPRSAGPPLVSGRHVGAGVSRAVVRAGRLANDSDYRFFTNAAHQKDSSAAPTDESPAATRSQDEMLLFYEVLSRAQETLTISYPAMDDKAQVLPPSPYVVELQRMFREGEQKIAVREAAALAGAASRQRSAASPIGAWRPWPRPAQTDGDRRLLAGIFSRDETQSLGAGDRRRRADRPCPRPRRIVRAERRPAHQPGRRGPARPAVRRRSIRGAPASSKRTRPARTSFFSPRRAATRAAWRPRAGNRFCPPRQPAAPGARRVSSPAWRIGQRVGRAVAR